MNEDFEDVQSGSESGSQGSEAQTVEVAEVNYSEQLDNIYELQYWSFGLLACFVGLFIAYILLSIINSKF